MDAPAQPPARLRDLQNVVPSAALMRRNLPHRDQVVTHLVMPAYVIPQRRKSASFLLTADVHCNVTVW